MADFENIAKQFVEYYYKAFDSDRASLAALYGQDSMLTFEATPLQGVGNIIQKLQELPFKEVQHQVATLDAQPADAQGSILVVVSGALLVEAEKRPMSYAQTFQLKPRDGSYYVFNDVFRLVYPAA
ncbi:Nuclear transport factor 2 [Elasticomyces elasticus]|uniref:Nuclear transport factor 2 n=1 Tax=Elasticomyces elasticus TaxID=574655 RepID=A0AAN8A0H2_9PEZI|nr:Nuclear transport factor 2 [Elasticomyces elasticus]KAK3628649.1 Nuclear transport factor 2 [Elasticomyces elasticus]KAK3634928.1 Nuclear transport factor 2 [Elasticomyces elasticus]KAK3651366.1 Nuclear transport factor 2 [Elasticomyces elasticus]KAK4902762.1 Nuclear transport factor 2 [Elasticomyces elasticus]